MTLALSTRYSYTSKATQKNGSVLPVVKLNNQPIRTMLSKSNFKINNLIPPASKLSSLWKRDISIIHGVYHKGQNELVNNQLLNHPGIVVITCKCLGKCICTPSNWNKKIKIIGNLTHSDNNSRFVKTNNIITLKNQDNTFIYFFKVSLIIKPIDIVYSRTLDKQIKTNLKNIVKIHNKIEAENKKNQINYNKFNVDNDNYPIRHLRSTLVCEIKNVFPQYKNINSKKKLPISDTPENSRKKSVKNKPDIRPKKENTIKQPNNHLNKTNIEKDKTFTSNLPENDFS